ncbi:MFS transporter [Pluralibacter gergoviae]|uniref:MFS transporter n=1 Tax=Pluralibacter gergoviae TaxID=61647 RepID=A0AAI9GPD2_PLUGE|nr:MFS transporter [Pluralibacter gergoviae]EKV0917795.1 MFS transporter [Pluralibacter gergoviae]EKV9909774.1 MFS transporter [Pluralibacter gergoviae]EKW7275863.1 MFS transporter [Pluralibacter gergoviae]ELD4298265.1 MFS transporter [Pluralibacter gergoviae]ELD4308957.1 MFS transporter [Pluralibacter gergoviae]
MSLNIEHATLLNKKPTHYRWWVAGLFFLIYTIAAADRANLGVALPFIRQQYHMTNAEAGALVSLFLIAYALIQIPSAWLITRYGVRKVFTTSMVFTSIATALTGFSGSVLQLKLCRVLLGIAEGPLPIGVSTTINNWFPSKEKGTASGIFLSSIKLGPVLTPIIGAAIILHWGWQEVFIFFALPGLILPIIWYLFVADKPAASRFVNRRELDVINEAAAKTSASGGQARYVKIPWLDALIRLKPVKTLTTTGEVVRSWNLLGCGLGYCCQLGISSLLLAWIPTYLLAEKHLSIVGMGFVAAAPWVGAVLGNLLGGLLSDKVLSKRRKPGMLISAVSTSVMMLLLIYVPVTPLTCALLLFMTGLLLSIGFSAYMVYPMSFIAKEKFPVANAIVNMFGQLGGAATPFIAGMILDSYGWNTVFLFMSAISLITFIVILTIDEPYGQA